MRQFFIKLKKRSGESLIETLVATLITVLGMMILAGAIVSAAKGSKAAKEMQSSLSPNTAAEGSSANVTVTYEDTSESFGVQLFNYADESASFDNGRLYFYEYEYGDD